jgi:hypothetical protein
MFSEWRMDPSRHCYFCLKCLIDSFSIQRVTWRPLFQQQYAHQHVSEVYLFIYLKVRGIAFHESVLGSPALGFTTGLVFRGWTSFHVTCACWSCWGRRYCSRHNLTTTLFIFLLVASTTQPGIESSNPCCHSIDKILPLWSRALSDGLKVTQWTNSPYVYTTHVHHWTQFSSSHPMKHLSCGFFPPGFLTRTYHAFLIFPRMCYIPPVISPSSISSPQ